MNQSNTKYRTGSLPISDTAWQVRVIRNGHIVNLGKPFIVKGTEVGAEMDAAHSIKGHMPSHLASKRARKLFPNADIFGVNQL